MTYSSSNSSREASLELSLQAMKSLLSSYVLRAKQAEQTAALLMQEKLTEAQLEVLHSTILAQLEQHSAERSVQQQALLQASLVTLNAAASSPDETCRTLVNTMLKDLTLALSHMNPRA